MITKWLFTQLAQSKSLVGIMVVYTCLPFGIVLDGILWLVQRYRASQVYEQESATCPHGHTVVLKGTWCCPSCKLTSETHAFAPCDHCGEVAHAVACACGMQVVNPLTPVTA